MKYLAVPLFFLIPGLAAAADGPVALGANGGKFGDWTAAAYGSGADKACYAFTPVAHTDLAASKRSAALLTVTERQGTRDEVTLSAGYRYPANATVTLTVGSNSFDFYTSGGTAFTTSGTAAVAAFETGTAAEAKSSGPRGKTVTDDFSLNGFSGAYAAIGAACP